MIWILIVIAIALVATFLDNNRANRFLRIKWVRDMEIVEIYLAHNQEQWRRTVQDDTISLFNRLRSTVTRLEGDVKEGVLRRLDFDSAGNIRNRAQTLAREVSALSTVIIQAMDKISAEEVKP